MFKRGPPTTECETKEFWIKYYTNERDESPTELKRWQSLFEVWRKCVNAKLTWRESPDYWFKDWATDWWDDQSKAQLFCMLDVAKDFPKVLTQASEPNFKRPEADSVKYNEKNLLAWFQCYRDIESTKNIRTTLAARRLETLRDRELRMGNDNFARDTQKRKLELEAKEKEDNAITENPVSQSNTRTLEKPRIDPLQALEDLLIQEKEQKERKKMVIRKSQYKAFGCIRDDNPTLLEGLKDRTWLLPQIPNKMHEYDVQNVIGIWEAFEFWNLLFNCQKESKRSQWNLLGIGAWNRLTTVVKLEEYEWEIYKIPKFIEFYFLEQLEAKNRVEQYLKLRGKENRDHTKQVHFMTKVLASAQFDGESAGWDAETVQAWLKDYQENGEYQKRSKEIGQDGAWALEYRLRLKVAENKHIEKERNRLIEEQSIANLQKTGKPVKLRIVPSYHKFNPDENPIK